MIVTEFESSSPQPEGKSYDYSEVFKALSHDKTVAENVFARCAKQHFRSAIGEKIKLKKFNELVGKPKLWLSRSEVVIEISDQARFPDDIYAMDLDRLTKSLIASVLSIRGDKEGMTLVGSLSTDIKEVHVNTYSFGVKQMWYLDG